MTIRETIRRRIDEWRKPPDVVPLAPTVSDRAKAAINWVMISVMVSALRMFLWLINKRK